MVGMVVGLLASAGVIGVDLLLGPPPGLAAILLGQPALWSVPLAFATMVLVSLGGRPPAGAAAAMLRLHLDERDAGGRDGDEFSAPSRSPTVMSSPSEQPDSSSLGRRRRGGRGRPAR